MSHQGDSPRLYREEDVVALGIKILAAFGFQPDDAEAATRVLVEADKRGISSHGFAGGTSVDDIVAKIAEGGINPSANPKVVDTVDPAVKVIHADGALGHVVGLRAVAMVKELAKQHGWAKVFVVGASHFGVAGVYSEAIAAEKNFIGTVMCTSPAWARPFLESGDYDGVGRLFGTNPIAISYPYDEGIFTIDFATTQKAVSEAIAVGKRNAARLREYNEHNSSTYSAEDVVALQNRYVLNDDGDAEGVLRQEIGLEPLKRGYMMTGSGLEMVYPPSDRYLIETCSLQFLGGTIFGYKGFGLNMLVDQELVRVGARAAYEIVPGGGRQEDRVAFSFAAERFDRLTPAQARMLGFRSDPLKLAGDYIRRIERECIGKEGFFIPGHREQLAREACERWRSEYGCALVPYTRLQLETVIEKVRPLIPEKTKVELALPSPAR